MKIPKTFELMGTKIEVVEDADIMQNDDASGMAIYRADKIKIAPSTPVYFMSQNKKEHVFLHELMHWIFYKLNKDDLRKDEDQVFDFGDEDQEDETFDFGDEDKEKTTPPTTQNIYNPLIIQQSGAGSTVIPNYGTINLDLGKRGGGSNE